MRHVTLAWGAVAALLVVTATPIVVADDDLATRIDSLVQELESKRVDHHIPGMSVVIVKDGNVLLSRGFGVSEVESEQPVDETTLFMIGSTTKAFTATLVGTFVDDGKMAWDAPIANYLPYFDPQVDSDDEGARVSVRDALSHRSGFSRMGMLLTAQNMKPREVLETANRAEPFDRFRQSFHYNNMMYVAAGTAAAESGGNSWQKLIHKRLFKPLGMKLSSATIAKQKGNLRTGYSWNDDLGELEPQPLLPIDISGPAGSIVSNAEEMGHWLTFLLDRGEYRGKRLIERATIEETWKPNIDVAPGISYGMGWFIRDWEGRKMLEHGGNIHGYAAQIALLPGENLGFAVMTNLSATPFQQESLPLIFGALLGQPEAEHPGEGEAGEAFDVFVGDYVADFGPFSETIFTVSEKDGALFVDVPGQTNYELKPPGEDGRRSFVLTDTISVDFEIPSESGYQMMRMHQGGLDFEIPRQGYEPETEIDPAEFTPFLGKYRSEQFQTEVIVRLSSNRLGIEIPGRITFELHPPEDDGRRRFRIRDAMSASFETNEEGLIDTIVLRLDDEVIETMPRTSTDDEQELPTLSQIMAIRASEERVAAFEAVGPLRSRARVRIVNAGLEGEATRWSDGKRVRSNIDFGRFGWVHVALREDGGERETHVTPIDDIEGRELRVSLQTELLGQSLDWREEFDEVRVLREGEVDETPVVLVRVQNPDTAPMTLHVDPKTGDILRVETITPVPGLNVDLPVTIDMRDYREVHGLRLPYRTIVSNPESGRTVIELEEIDFDVELCDGMFDLREKPTCGG